MHPARGLVQLAAEGSPPGDSGGGEAVEACGTIGQHIGLGVEVRVGHPEGADVVVVAFAVGQPVEVDGVVGGGSDFEGTRGIGDRGGVVGVGVGGTVVADVERAGAAIVDIRTHHPGIDAVAENPAVVVSVGGLEAGGVGEGGDGVEVEDVDHALQGVGAVGVGDDEGEGVVAISAVDDRHGVGGAVEHDSVAGSHHGRSPCEAGGRVA